MRKERVVPVVRMVALGAALVLTALSLGGCFLFPRRAAVVQGTLGSGRIQGQVVDKLGQPIAGASATIPEAAQYTAVSGADGRFSFPGLAAGVYYVRVEKEGYLSGSFVALVAGGPGAEVKAVLLDTSSYLHNDSRRVPNLCGDCHVLHNPTAASHLTLGATPNSPCFKSGCHAPVGTNRGFDASVYENSPHGRNWGLNSSTQPAWTGQPSTERGNCATCHEPHGITGPPFMLRKGIRDADGTLHLNDLCLECHNDPGTGHTAGWPGRTAYLDSANLHVNATSVPATTRKSYPGTTYAMGDCLNCHVPHGQSTGGANDPRMLRDKGYKLCLKCHTDKLDTGGSGHNGNCLLCHDPHSITKTGGFLNVKDPANGTSQSPVSKGTHRGQTVASNGYCVKCHAVSPPSWVTPVPRDPFKSGASHTGFWNQTSYQPWVGTWNNQNLHVVHVQRVWGYGGAGYHSDPGSDENKVWCGLCHTLHRDQTSITHNLSRQYFTGTTGSYTGTWQGKAGCGVQANCHSCNWCHASPGSPGWSCSACYHGSAAHSGIAY